MVYCYWCCGVGLWVFISGGVLCLMMFGVVYLFVCFVLGWVILFNLCLWMFYFVMNVLFVWLWVMVDYCGFGLELSALLFCCLIYCAFFVWILGLNCLMFCLLACDCLLVIFAFVLLCWVRLFLLVWLIFGLDFVLLYSLLIVLCLLGSWRALYCPCIYYTCLVWWWVIWVCFDCCYLFCIGIWLFILCLLCVVLLIVLFACLILFMFVNLGVALLLLFVIVVFCCDWFLWNCLLFVTYCCAFVLFCWILRLGYLWVSVILRLVNLGFAYELFVVFYCCYLIRFVWCYDWFGCLFFVYVNSVVWV